MWIAGTILRGWRRFEEKLSLSQVWSHQPYLQIANVLHIKKAFKKYNLISEPYFGSIRFNKYS
jgi:hypothetical protein